MKIGFIERILEVLGFLQTENKRLQKENAILRVVLRFNKITIPNNL